MLNPLVAAARSAARFPRGLAVARWCTSASCSSLAGVGLLLANPVTDQVKRLQRDVPDLVDDANQLAGRPPALADDNGHPGPDPAARARRRCRRCRTGAQSARATSCRFGQRRAPAAWSRPRFGAHPRARHLDLHAALRPSGSARSCAAVDAAGRRHAGRRLPAARPAGGVRLRARAAAVQPDHGRRAPASCLWILGVARHLPRRPALRALLRRLLRPHGADPVRRARSSAASRRCSSRCSATR